MNTESQKDKIVAEIEEILALAKSRSLFLSEEEVSEYIEYLREDGD